MSPMYKKIKAWYDSGAWPESWVRNAYDKGKITHEELQDILGVHDDEENGDAAKS